MSQLIVCSFPFLVSAGAALLYTHMCVCCAGFGERSVRRPGAAEKRQHRGGDGAAGLPGHRHGDHHGQEGAGAPSLLLLL